MADAMTEDEIRKGEELARMIDTVLGPDFRWVIGYADKQGEVKVLGSNDHDHQAKRLLGERITAFNYENPEEYV
jgi:hypothetical protein